MYLRREEKEKRGISVQIRARWKTELKKDSAGRGNFTSSDSSLTSNAKKS